MTFNLNFAGRHQLVKVGRTNPKIWRNSQERSLLWTRQGAQPFSIKIMIGGCQISYWGKTTPVATLQTAYTICMICQSLISLQNCLFHKKKIGSKKYTAICSFWRTKASDALKECEIWGGSFFKKKKRANIKIFKLLLKTKYILI